MKNDWVGVVQLALKIGFLLGGIYLAVVYYQRWTAPPLERPKPEPIKLPREYYVHPPKSYATDLASAKKLVGKPLWVKEGYRWSYQPGDRLFDPIQRIVPTGIRQRGGEVRLEFEEGGTKAWFAIGSHERVYIDEIFFITDPRELFGYWPAEVWQKIEQHQVEAGMTEYQIVFAIGAGEVVRSSPGAMTRVVDYKVCEGAGLQPVRVTYQNGVAESIEELPRRPGG